MQRLLWKLFHIEKKLKINSKSINDQNKDLVTLREEQKEHDEKLAEAREEQAKARSEVSKRERRIRKQEKAMEAKVDTPVFLFCQSYQ
jgi:structural maintenance of chromosome 1